MPEQRLSLTAGLDLGDRHIHLVIVGGIGGHEAITVRESDIVDTTPDAVRTAFTDRAPMRIVLEVGTPARWIARTLEALGHEVLVCNPRSLREIYTNPRKSDFVDAETLARIGHTDPNRLVTHRGYTARDTDALHLVRSRHLLVRNRARIANRVRAMVKSVGARLPPAEGDRFHTLAPHIPAELRDATRPLMRTAAATNEAIFKYDRAIHSYLTAHYPDPARRLLAIHGVGPITTLTFIAVIGDPHRFTSSRHVGSYLGFAPRRRQSGARDPQLGVTRAGDKLLRGLLVGAALTHTTTSAPDGHLHAWARRRLDGADRLTRKRTLVAVARKLGVVMHRMLMTGEEFEPWPHRAAPSRPREGAPPPRNAE